jgi:hypothetical protein
MSGFFLMHRGWRDCDVFADGEPMSEREAWIWLIEKAAWKQCHRRTLKGERIVIERGQFHTSYRCLERAWGWGKNKVHRFIERLEDHEMIGTAAGQSGTIITISNYDTYQYQRDGRQPESGTAAGQPWDTQEQGKQGKQENGEAREGASRLPDDFSIPEDWIAWAIQRRSWSRAYIGAEGERFCRYWQAKAGKDSYKLDWLKMWQNWVDGSSSPNGVIASSRPLSAEEIQRGIAYNEGHGNPERADELRKQLAELRAQGPPPAIAGKRTATRLRA